MGYTDMYDLSPYVNRCALICLGTLARRRSDACVMFVFDVLSGRVCSPSLLSLINVITPRYCTWGDDFLQIRFLRTNCGVHDSLNDAVRNFLFVKESIFLSSEIGVVISSDSSQFSLYPYFKNRFKNWQLYLSRLANKLVINNEI
jgi:hypothetical protein